MKAVLPTLDGAPVAERSATVPAAWSVHAVIASKAVRELDRPSLGDHVQLVLRGGITAVVSPAPVDLLDMADRDLPNEEAPAGPDAEALARAAREHERIVEAVLACTDVVPFRFGLVVRSWEEVDQLLSKEEGRLSSSLHSVAGCCEWSVFLLSERDGVAAAGFDPPSRRTGASDTPGRDYLLQRKRERQAAAEMAERFPAQLRSIAAALASSTCRSVRSEGRPTDRGSLAEDESSLSIGRLACLVERRSEKEFFAELENALEAVGAGSIRAEVTGPWPAYHFVEASLEGSNGIGAEGAH